MDVYRGKGEDTNNFFYVGLYLPLFPQLIASPIVRYGTIKEEMRIVRKL